MSNRRNRYFGVEEKARIEIIPMIDVMMFLLVFFVLIMTEMIHGAGIPLALPRASSAEPLEITQINLGVDKAGGLYIDGHLAESAVVLNRLRELNQTKKVVVVISGEQSTSYQNIVKVMDLARAAGIESVGLATARS